ncbi:AraC family transcriptional regulator [Jiangella alba]|uniref:AraC-type DNA-binding protein n=1 Tax=Jiangella alba TaxID=561176 RepID=A0A1H5PQC5_9ACTN|nr:AraC family transcriptional regulator [Jiangella alba]SEF15177.1 AraC-type DNA-binding protein [Jiangella alba]
MEDALSSLLGRLRPHGVVFSRSAMTAPWSLRFVEGAPLTLVTPLSGGGWITLDDAEPVRLETLDVALVVGARPYTVSDRRDTPPRVVVHEADRCTTPGGAPVDDDLDMCRLDTDGDTSVLLKSTYQVQGTVPDRILSALPPLLVVPACPCPAMDMIVAELADDKPGQQVMLDRLLDLLLISTLREWLDRPDSCAPTWYRAHGDAVVGTALRLIHDDPAHPWTVAELAAKAGASRAAFARRFTGLVGQAPMAYLTDWRMCLAADLLRDTDATVEAIAHRVGYANAYALSVAFTRVYGTRPSRHRAASA